MGLVFRTEPDSYDLCAAEYNKLPQHERDKYKAIAPPAFAQLKYSFDVDEEAKQKVKHTTKS